MTTPSKRRRLKLKKGGRPRKQGIRTRSGRLSRSKEAKDYISAKAAEENRAVALEARSRHNKVPVEEANNPLLGSEIGRLYNRHLLARKKKVQQWRSLTEKEYEAAQRFSEDISRYYGLSGIPHPNPKSANLFGVRGYDSEESESQQKTADRVSKRAYEIQKALLSKTQGRRILEKVYNVCILDHSTDNWSTVQYGEFRHGIKALVKYYNGEG